jgi:quinol monooxygenase YgiN
MATISLGLHYYIKDGHRDTVLSKLKAVVDLCTKEPEFVNAIISESPERPNQFVLQELWRGTLKPRPLLRRHLRMKNASCA